MQNRQPTLFVVAGPNGAGKSTHSIYLLPEDMQQIAVWDFDMQFYEFKRLAIAKGMKPKQAIAVAEEQVSSLFNERRKACMQQQLSFAYEGHFTGGAQWQPLLEARQQGFYVHLVYLGLSHVHKSVGRVLERVRSGGHYVGEQNIKMNYYGNLDMLDLNFRLPHRVDMYETDKSLYKICTITKGIVAECKQVIPLWIKNEMPQLNAALEAFLSI